MVPGCVNFTHAHEFVINANRALTKLIPDSVNEFTVQSKVLLFTLFHSDSPLI